MKIPFVMVMAPYAGTSPEDMENLVTRKLEKELKGLEDLKEMTSSSAYGMTVHHPGVRVQGGHERRPAVGA